MELVPSSSREQKRALKDEGVAQTFLVWTTFLRTTFIFMPCMPQTTIMDEFRVGCCDTPLVAPFSMGRRRRSIGRLRNVHSNIIP